MVITLIGDEELVQIGKRNYLVADLDDDDDDFDDDDDYWDDPSEFDDDDDEDI